MTREAREEGLAEEGGRRRPDQPRQLRDVHELDPTEVTIESLERELVALDGTETVGLTAGTTNVVVELK